METRETTGFASAESATLVAQLGSVCRLNPDYFNSSPLGFVLDEALKLEVAPVAYPVVHSLAKPSSPDSFEVFQHYLSTIKSGDDALADVVINPSHEPLLSATQLPKKLLGRTSAFSLKNRTQMLKLSLDLLDFGRMEEPAFAGDGEVVNSEVNAKNTFLQSIVKTINLFREPKQEETFTFSIDTQEAFSQLPAFEVFNVTGRNFDVEFLSAFEQPQSENIALETGRTGEIVANRSFADYGLAFGSLNHSTSLPDTSHSKLCWQGLPQPLVNEGVQFDVVPYSAIPSLVNAELQSLTVSPDSNNYLIGSDDFDLGNSNSTTNHTQQQRSTTINTLAGEMSSVQCFLQKNRKVFGNITTQSPQAAGYQLK